jgi:putative ABC transport system permease protein
MGTSVPLARRNVLAEPRRLVATAVGVGLALMLILLLDGLWEGIRQRITAYQDNVGAELFVGEAGSRNFLGGTSVVPIETVDQVRSLPGVSWAVPVRGFFTIVELHGEKVPAYVVGSNPGDAGGVWELSSGRSPIADDEVVIGDVIARRHGLALDGQIDIMGEPFRIVGTGPDAFMAPFAFMTHAATDGLLRAPGTTSFVLVGTENPAAVREQLDHDAYAVLDRDELAANDLAMTARAYEVPLRVMRAVALAIGTLIIALSVYTAVMERRREYGIVKALGARARDLLSLTVRQTTLLAFAGLVAGGALFTGSRLLIQWARPQFDVVVTSGSVGRVGVAALLMAAAASVVPARRLAKLEPAVAYRGG